MQEDQRIRWTIYRNINSWFDNWGHNLVELGFATKLEDGNVDFINNQLKQIINIDKTCLALDGGNGKQGGRPLIVYVGKNLPDSGKSFSKSSITVTMITGSTAASEAIPPHFQFSTAAKSEDCMQICLELMQFMPNIKGQFCCDVEHNWPVTFGMNAKGGMDDVEYKSIFYCQLFPCF